MKGEVISRSYDGIGKLVSQPSKKRHRFFKPTFPMGTYISQPLATKCNSLEEIRLFLAKCRYVSDQEQFNQADYWMPPEQFKKLKKGDCDDFALWAWRQLIAIGYDARFVFLVLREDMEAATHGFTSPRMAGHTAARLGPGLPRLSTHRYQPRLSVAWDGKRLQYYEHENRSYDPSLWEIIILVGEWLPFWIRTRSRGCYAWARYFIKRTIYMFRMSTKSA
jgi:hypothetical protein